VPSHGAIINLPSRTGRLQAAQTDRQTDSGVIESSWQLAVLTRLTVADGGVGAVLQGTGMDVVRAAQALAPPVSLHVGADADGRIRGRVCALWTALDHQRLLGLVLTDAGRYVGVGWLIHQAVGASRGLGERTKKHKRASSSEPEASQSDTSHGRWRRRREQRAVIQYRKQRLQPSKYSTRYGRTPTAQNLRDNKTNTMSSNCERSTSTVSIMWPSASCTKIDNGAVGINYCAKKCCST
jgi:hypothetical protein